MKHPASHSPDSLKSRPGWRVYGRGVFIAWLGLLATACASPPAGPTPSPAPETPAPPGLVTVAPAATPGLTPAEAYPPLPAATPTLAGAYPPPTPAFPSSSGDAYPAPTVTPEEGSLAGLVYVTKEGVWLVESLTRLRQLTPDNRVVVSPGATQGAYFDQGDVWVVDLLAGGSPRNLTQTPAVEECCWLAWPMVDWLTVGAHPAGAVTFNLGALRLIHPITGETRPINPPDTVAFGEPALSPDGQQVAYDQAGVPFLYRLEGTQTPFDPTAYTWSTEVELARLGSPAWSPDGRQLVWSVNIVTATDDNAALALFDWQTQAARLLHPYQMAGRDGWFPAARWSPDGRWLALVTEAIEAATAGVWVVAADGSQEQFLGPGSNPVWSPDGTQLVYHNGAHNVLVQLGNWQQSTAPLPLEALVQTWGK